jgi:uncharacterized membrane protein (UPF0127 family)
MKFLAVTASLALATAACSGGDGAAPGPMPEGSARPERFSERVPGAGTGGGEGSTGAAGPQGREVARPRFGAPAVVLKPPGRDPVRVRVEVARTPAETRRGLMFRRELEPDAGMLFVFERAQRLTFWMRNTWIPLDMIFITPDRRVLGIVENAEPETDDPREVEGRSQFVLEVNAGFARAHGIVPGTPVRFENVPELPAAAAASHEDDEEEDE